MAKSAYVVHTNGTVFRARTLKAAQYHIAASGIEGTAFAASDESLAGVPTAVLVTLHNLVRPERPVTRFSDRATAEKRLEGVLDLLAKKSIPEQTAGPATPKAPKAPKEPKEPKGPRGRPSVPVTDAEMKEVVKRRKNGEGWLSIVAEMGKPRNFIFKARAALKATHPDMVLEIGPGSPNYGKGPKPRPERPPRVPGAKRAKRAAKTSGVPREAF